MCELNLLDPHLMSSASSRRLALEAGVSSSCHGGWGWAGCAGAAGAAVVGRCDETVSSGTVQRHMSKRENET